MVLEPKEIWYPIFILHSTWAKIYYWNTILQNPQFLGCIKTPDSSQSMAYSVIFQSPKVDSCGKAHKRPFFWALPSVHKHEPPRHSGGAAHQGWALKLKASMICTLLGSRSKRSRYGGSGLGGWLTKGVWWWLAMVLWISSECAWRTQDYQTQWIVMISEDGPVGISRSHLSYRLRPDLQVRFSYCQIFKFSFSAMDGVAAGSSQSKILGSSKKMRRLTMRWFFRLNIYTTNSPNMIKEDVWSFSKPPSRTQLRRRRQNTTTRRGDRAAFAWQRFLC